jgi:hypothetical protein
MPTTPTSIKCNQLGCKNDKAHLGGYCLTHGGRTYDRSKQQRDSVYHTKYWHRTRKHQLSIQPLCQGCLLLNKVVQGSHVDHLFAWRKLSEEAFKLNVLQSLCNNCHSHKTSLEQQGIYRHYSKTAIDYELLDYGRVVGSHTASQEINFY